ncbi:MAG: DUF4180 domain-containing protein [Candidatus Marinimicrobia bacterium]|nr:DUF4180 domain-containing protein [Candidatus Neomarinimicrobiota bacterium]
MQVNKTNGKTFIEGTLIQVLIKNERDAVDVIGFCGEHEAIGVLLYLKNLPEDFFDLNSGQLGTIIQKFVTYYLKVALVLSPEFVKSRFKKFAAESNRGNHFRTFYNRVDAVEWLAKN